MEELANVLYWIGHGVRRTIISKRNDRKDDYFYWSNFVIGAVVVILFVLLIYILFLIFN